MKRTLIYIILIAIPATLFAYLLSKSRISEESQITAEDLLWATNVQIWKLDLSVHDNVTGLRLAVYNSENQLVASSGSINNEIPMNPNSGYRYAIVSCKKTEADIEGRFRIGGATADYKFENLFKNGWSFSNAPNFMNDKYYLASEGAYPLSSNEQNTSKKSHSLVIELIKTKPQAK